MGVRHLQTFIQTSVPNGYIEISLIDECDSFHRENKVRPILLIDLMGAMRPLIKCERELLCGVRHNEMYNPFEKLLQKLSAVCELVFFEDGPVNEAKSQTWMKRQNVHYDSSQRVLDKINSNCTLEEIVKSEENLNAGTSILKICEFLAKKYGTLTIAVNKECDAEMARFACRNDRVMAILADDSDFLIYPGLWRYFSLRELNEETLVTMEYNRQALRKHLNLNDDELVLLSTLNGNDFINFKDIFHFHKKLTHQPNNAGQRFLAIAEYIKSSKTLKSRTLYKDIANTIYGRSPESFVKKVKDSFQLYDVTFEIPELHDRFLKYCREKSLNFIFSILSFTPITFSLGYFDIRKMDKYTERTLYTFRKQIGIILRQPRQYQVYAKMSHNDIFRGFSVEPILPTYQFPPLGELLDRSKYPQHDNIRFNLLKWLISDKDENHGKFELIPKNIFVDILVLIYMVDRGYMEMADADIVMLSIKKVNDSTVPEKQ